MRANRAVSPAIATLLLILIATATIAATVVWVMDYRDKLFSWGQPGVVLKQSEVRFYGNGSMIDIDVQNNGASNTTITQVYIGQSSTSMDNQTFTPIQLAAGTTQRISIAYTWTLRTTYYFKIITTSGKYLLFPWTAPSSYS